MAGPGTGQPIPAHPLELTAEWLTEALAERHPGTVVASVDVTDVREVTNTHVRLRVGYAETGDIGHAAPARLFVKLLPLVPDRRTAVAATGMGPREARFYRDLAPTSGLRTPEVHVARSDDSTGAFVVALEDLDASNCLISDGTWGIDPDAAAGALEGLARMHVRYEDPSRRLAEAAWVPEATHGRSYGATLLRYGLDHHRHRLSANFAAMAELYIADNAALHGLWHRGPLTVVHGDPHIGNVFVDDRRVGFLDWGIVNVTSPMRDVSYFLNMAMSINDRRAHEISLMRHYLDVRRALGALPITFDEAWLAHRLHTAYTVPACCQIVTFPVDAIESRRVFAAAFLSRAEAALADLEARKAVDEQLAR